MKINFWKMQSLGNDFVVLDATKHPLFLTPLQIKYIADRHFGVGCDQILILEKARNQHEDFFYRIFNADGSEVGQCGNGARCMGLFIREHGFTQKEIITLGTITTTVKIKFDKNDRQGLPPPRGPELVERIMESSVFCQANLGKPHFEENRKIETALEQFQFFVLNLGNPHAVMIVPSVAEIDVKKLGKEISTHASFPEQTNVIFMELLNPREIKCRIYERGVGETLACGSGAAASVVAGVQQSLLDNEVLVHLSGGDLEVNIREGEVWLKGPANKVFKGVLDDLENADFA